MSLASYFTKKSGPKATRVNLAVVSDSGETKTVGIRSLTSSGRKDCSLSSCSDDFETRKPKSNNNLPLGQGKSQRDKFVFGFSVGEECSSTEQHTTSSSKKRRQRQKNKIKCSEKVNQQIIELEERKDIDPQIVPNQSETSTTNEEIKKDELLYTPTNDETNVETHDNFTNVQPPPGFNSKATENESIPTSTLLRPSDKFRKTPGKKKSKENKKLSVARQMQLHELDQRRKNERTIRPKQQEMKIQFNTVTKGKAMVNRGSLAVHREKSKQVGRQAEQSVQEVNPFSFGFNFSTLLNVPDNLSDKK